MVTRFGMVEKLGLVGDLKGILSQIIPLVESRERTEWMQHLAEAKGDTAVRDIVRQAFDKAVGILRSKRAILERTAQKLLEKETLTEADLKALVPEPAQSAA